jgi:hypothetical protein
LDTCTLGAVASSDQKSREPVGIAARRFLSYVVVSSVDWRSTTGASPVTVTVS